MSRNLQSFEQIQRTLNCTLRNLAYYSKTKTEDNLETSNHNLIKPQGLTGFVIWLLAGTRGWRHSRRWCPIFLPCVPFCPYMLPINHVLRPHTRIHVTDEGKDGGVSRNQTSIQWLLPLGHFFDMNRLDEVAKSPVMGSFFYVAKFVNFTSDLT